MVRFIRSDGRLDIFGEKFRIPPEAIYEYVVATIEVKEQKLKLYLDKVQIDEIDYKLFWIHPVIAITPVALRATCVTPITS